MKQNFIREGVAAYLDYPTYKQKPQLCQKFPKSIEGIGKLPSIAFGRFRRSWVFDASPLLSGVCGFVSNTQCRQNRPKTDRTDSFAIPSIIKNKRFRQYKWVTPHLHSFYKDSLSDHLNHRLVL